jgi:hypothetical protein
VLAAGVGGDPVAARLLEHVRIDVIAPFEQLHLEARARRGAARRRMTPLQQLQLLVEGALGDVDHVLEFGGNEPGPCIRERC